MRLNPNPKYEKMKDFRKSYGNSRWCGRSTITQWCSRKANHAYRQKWKQRRWFYEYYEDVEITKYTSRHQVLWDLA